MNPLREIFENNTSNAIHKWMHYFDIYDRYFNKYRNKKPVVLEIGVFQGGSLRMWRDYFGTDAEIYAIDINPLCKQFETHNTKIFIGSQDDRDFLKSVRKSIPPIDILIDDGGHTMKQQIVTFEELFSHVKEDGIYLCEDLHTSYWNNYGGGYKKKNTFIEYSKNFIDYIHAWHSKEKALQVNDFTKSVYGLHYYDSILVIEKQKITPPENRISGNLIFSMEHFPQPSEHEKEIIGYAQSVIRKIIKK